MSRSFSLKTMRVMRLPTEADGKCSPDFSPPQLKDFRSLVVGKLKELPFTHMIVLECIGHRDQLILLL